MSAVSQVFLFVHDSDTGPLVVEPSVVVVVVNAATEHTVTIPDFSGAVRLDRLFEGGLDAAQTNRARRAPERGEGTWTFVDYSSP